MLYVYEILPISTLENVWDFLLKNYSLNMMPCNFTIKRWCFQYS